MATTNFALDTPAYPGLHGCDRGTQRLEPKSPGYNLREEEELRNWRQEIQDLIDFVATEAPPKARRTSRELLRNGSRHLRQMLRVRNSDRFCHIVQDPKFLKDMDDPSIYLINCNARALSKGQSVRAGKSSVHRRRATSEIARDWVFPEDSIQTLRGLSKRSPLNSHPSRGYSCTVRSEQVPFKNNEGPAPVLNRHYEILRSNKTRPVTAPQMHCALCEVEAKPESPNAILPEFPFNSLEPFSLTPPSTSGFAHARPQPGPLKAVTPKQSGHSLNTAATSFLGPQHKIPGDEATPASSMIHLSPVPLLASDRTAAEALPWSLPESPTNSHDSAPFLSRKGSTEFPRDGNNISRNFARDASPNLFPKPGEQAVSPSPGRLASSRNNPVKSPYVAAGTAWSTNAAVARQRLAHRVDLTRRVKQRDCERSRERSRSSRPATEDNLESNRFEETTALPKAVTETSSPATQTVSHDEKTLFEYPTSHELFCSVEEEAPMTDNRKSEIYDNEGDLATQDPPILTIPVSKIFQAESPALQGEKGDPAPGDVDENGHLSGTVDLEDAQCQSRRLQSTRSQLEAPLCELQVAGAPRPSTNNSLSEIITIAETVPKPPPPARTWSGRQNRVVYRSHSTQCSPEDFAEEDLDQDGSKVEVISGEATDREDMATVTNASSEQQIQPTSPIQGLNAAMMPRTPEPRRHYPIESTPSSQLTDSSVQTRADAYESASSMDSAAQGAFARLESRLDSQLAAFNQRTETLERALAVFLEGAGGARHPPWRFQELPREFHGHLSSERNDYGWSDCSELQGWQGATQAWGGQHDFRHAGEPGGLGMETYDHYNGLPRIDEAGAV